MNIFKILANGDGSINEANVSAFLGYLLDPKADHALGSEFLYRFLEMVNGENDNFESEFHEMDYQIFYEQAFKDEDQAKQIVDLVIVAYQTTMNSGKESLIHDFVNNSKDIKRLYLIENKIRKGALSQEQLVRQFKSSVTHLPSSYGTKISSIYLTPNDDKYVGEFEKARNEIPDAHHIHWNSDESDSTSILELLHSLLEEEVFGKIEPLNEYTVHTIKAFFQFIENDFQSERQLEKIRKHDGSYSEKFRRLNENSNIVEKLNRLKNELVSQDKMFENLILGPSLASVRHPELYILINGVKIGINAGYSTRDKISFGYTINRNDPDSMQKLSSLVEKLGIKLKKQNDKYYAYCRTEEMKKTIKLNNPSKIEAKLKKVIQYTE